MYIPSFYYRPWGSYTMANSFHFYSEDGSQHNYVLTMGIPRDGRTVKDPSYFVEFNKIKEGNSVIHVKWRGYPLGPYGERYATTGMYRVQPTLSTENPITQYIRVRASNGILCAMSLRRTGSTLSQNRYRNKYIFEYQCHQVTTDNMDRTVRRYCIMRWYVDRTNTGETVVTDRYSSGISADILPSIESYLLTTIPEYQFGSSPSGDAIWSQWVSDNLNMLWDMYSWIRPSGTYSRANMTEYQVTISIPDSLDSHLLLDEYNLLVEGLSMKPFAQYHTAAMEQLSYLDALDHVPIMNENNISNIISLVSFIKGIVIDHRVEIPKSLSSAWLKYRYEYTTTKSDVREAINFMHRTVGRDLFGRGFDCYGRTLYTYNNVPITVRCHVSMIPKELELLDRIWTGLYKYGLSPSFYVLWDSIPYSFIVDWFIPIGDILSGYDKTRMYDRTYTISNIWYSMKYVVTDETGTYTSYTRWSGGCPPEFQGYYSLENKGTVSDKVIGFRILDLFSLSFK